MATSDDKVVRGVVHWRGSVSDFITDARDLLGDHWLDLVRELTDDERVRALTAERDALAAQLTSAEQQLGIARWMMRK
jgi:hypothetical protein